MITATKFRVILLVVQSGFVVYKIFGNVGNMTLGELKLAKYFVGHKIMRLIVSKGAFLITAGGLASPEKDH